MKEFTDGESNFTALLQRAMEMEGVDRETLHQLVFLLMKVSLLTCLVFVAADFEHHALSVVIDRPCRTKLRQLWVMGNCSNVSCRLGSSRICFASFYSVF